MMEEIATQWEGEREVVGSDRLGGAHIQTSGK